MAMTLERCAELRAEMDAGKSRDAVLARAGVDDGAWIVAQREWLDKMGAELQRGRFELTNRYTEAFLARQRELARAPGSPTATHPGLLQGPSTMDPPRSPALEPSAPPLPLPAMVGPTPAPDAPSPWSGEARPARPAALPPTASAPVPETMTASMPAWVDGAAPPQHSALPFQPGPPAKAPGPPGAAPPRAPQAPTPPAKQDLGATTMGELSPFVAALPFIQTAAPPTGTVTGAASTSGLPFTPSAPAAPAPASPAAPAPPTVGGLTLEQHASLCAEIAHAPTRVEEILSRYRATPESKAEMDQSWKRRFSAEPALERQWHEAYKVYFGFLQSTQRR